MAKVSTRAYVSPYSNHPIDDFRQFDNHTRPSEVPSHGDIYGGIFVAIIVGAACAFAYVVYADDSGRTGP